MLWRPPTPSSRQQATPRMIESQPPPPVAPVRPPQKANMHRGYPPKIRPPRRLRSRHRFRHRKMPPRAVSRHRHPSARQRPPPQCRPSQTNRASTPPTSTIRPPGYPALARRLGEEGTVRIRVWVTREGRAGKVELSQSAGSPRLDRTALETVSRWRFEPARERGEPVDQWVIVPIKFKLENPSQ